LNSACEAAKALRSSMRFSGAYVVLIKVGSALELKTRRRTFEVGPGLYAYVGSARGRRSVAERVARHACKSGNPFWHVDYLLRGGGEVVGFFAIEGADERAVASLLAQAFRRVKGFGSSDDPRSGSHLFIIADSSLLAGLLVRSPGAGRVLAWLQREGSSSYSA